MRVFVEYTDSYFSGKRAQLRQKKMMTEKQKNKKIEQMKQNNKKKTI